MIEQNNVNAVFNRYVQQVLRGVTAVVSLIKDDAKQLAPVKTGHHKRSIDYVVTQSATEIVGVVGHASDYGQFLEFGTRFMAARPHFRPAFDKWGPQAAEIIARAS